MSKNSGVTKVGATTTGNIHHPSGGPKGSPTAHVPKSVAPQHRVDPSKLKQPAPPKAKK